MSLYTLMGCGVEKIGEGLRSSVLFQMLKKGQEACLKLSEDLVWKMRVLLARESLET